MILEMQRMRQELKSCEDKIREQAEHVRQVEDLTLTLTLTLTLMSAR